MAAGRQGELEEVRQAIVSVPHGVIVAGAAGVGETRLAREALAALLEEGYAVEWASGSAGARAISFGAIPPWLEPMAGRDLSYPLDATRVVRANLEKRHRGRPVVLAVDDAHLLDPASALLLQQLLGSGSARLLLTVRTGEPLPDAIVKLWKDELAIRIELQALSDTETDVLLRTALGGEVEPTTSRRYWNRSGGNPVGLRELVLESLRAGRRRQRGDAWFLGDDRVPTSGTRLVELIGGRLASVDLLLLVGREGPGGRNRPEAPRTERGGRGGGGTKAAGGRRHRETGAPRRGRGADMRALAGEVELRTAPGLGKV